MAAEAARVLDDSDDYIYGSAIPARKPYARPDSIPLEFPPQRDIPLPQDQPGEWQREQPQRRERAADAAAQRAHGVSLFALLGSLFIASLMVFTILAQVRYNEVASDIVRLNAQLTALEEEEKRLEIAFESVVDMKEIERYARDVLGMSIPEVQQVAIIQGEQQDSAKIVARDEDEGWFRGITSFISSLTDYFKK